MDKSTVNSLISFSNDIISKRIKNTASSPEFCKLANSLEISSIIRITSCNDDTIEDTSSVQIYDDNRFESNFSKEYTRALTDVRITYRIFSAKDFSALDEDTAQIYELLINIFCMGYSCNYLFEDEKLKRNYDKDSGIPNIHGFNKFCEKVIADGRITEYAAIRANIKGCNLLNNLYGYNSTTEIISKFASVLNSLMENDEICARLGGDNFSLLLKKSNLSKHLEEFAGIPVTCYIGQEKVTNRIALRAGIVEISDDMTEFGTVMARADSCLDVSKRKQETDVVYYDRDTIRRELELTLIETELPYALENNEFLVYYQPKVRIDNRTMIGAEALIRWKKNGRIISPMDFIPIAERTGLIRKLDFFVLEYTCYMLNKWREDGKIIVPISVNFSKIHLRFPHFADNIMKIIEKYDIPPFYIEIEFTETAYMDDFNAIKAAVADLKSHGVVVSMDDFGTGYSSLALLKDLNFDVLKLDKSIASNNSDERGLVVLENVLHMAGELNMITVCEGIEEKDNVDNLRDMGCNIIQGYYFDRPLPEDEFANRLLNPVYNK